MIGVQLESSIPARVEKIWQIIEDSRRLPQWFAFAEKIEVLEGSGEGMKMRLSGRWRTRRSEVDVEVTAFEPNRLIAWRHLAERVDGREVPRYSRETRFAISLEPQGEDTKVRLRSEQDPAGPVRGVLIMLLGRREAKRRMALSLQRLKMVASTV